MMEYFFKTQFDIKIIFITGRRGGGGGKDISLSFHLVLKYFPAGSSAWKPRQWTQHHYSWMYFIKIVSTIVLYITRTCAVQSIQFCWNFWNIFGAPFCSPQLVVTHWGAVCILLRGCCNKYMSRRPSDCSKAESMGDQKVLRNVWVWGTVCRVGFFCLTGAKINIA